MATNSFLAINFYALLTTGALFAISELGETETLAGFAAGVYVIGSLISRTFLSRYANRVGFKRMLYISVGALVVFSALHFVVSGFVLLCVVRFFCGVSFGINNNTLMTTVASLVPYERKGEGIAWYSLSQILGMALGPFFAVYIIHAQGFNGVFFLITAVAVLAFILLLFIRLPQGIEQFQDLAHFAPETEEKQYTGIWKFFERGAIKIALLCLIMYICNVNYMSFAAVFVSDSGAENLASFIFLANALAMLATRPFVGKIFDKYGPNILLIIGFIIAAAGLFLLSRGTYDVFIPSSLLIGLGISAFQGTTIAMVIKNAPPHRLSVTNATYFNALDLGAAVGPVIGGGIAEFAGYGTMYSTFAVITILCLPLYFLVLARRSPA